MESCNIIKFEITIRSFPTWDQLLARRGKRVKTAPAWALLARLVPPRQLKRSPSFLIHFFFYGTFYRAGERKKASNSNRRFLYRAMLIVHQITTVQILHRQWNIIKNIAVRILPLLDTIKQPWRNKGSRRAHLWKLIKELSNRMDRTPFFPFYRLKIMVRR